MKRKAFLFLADLHAGSAFAPCPKGFVGSHGGIIDLNIGQQYLLEIYKDILSECPSQLDGLVFMGDMVDGTNPKGEARFLSEQDAVRQVKMAEKLASPFVSRVKATGRIYSLRGSKYHTGGDHFEEMFADHVGAEKDRMDYYTHSWLKLPLFDEETLLIDASHHQSYTRTNKVMPLEREIREALATYPRQGEKPPAHIFIARAHTHHGFRMVQEDDYATAVTVPSMKLQDEFAAGGKRPNDTKPDRLGALIVYFYDSFPYVKVRPVLWKHPIYVEETFE